MEMMLFQNGTGYYGFDIDESPVKFTWFYSIEINKVKTDLLGDLFIKTPDKLFDYDDDGNGIVCVRGIYNQDNWKGLFD